MTDASDLKSSSRPEERRQQAPYPSALVGFALVTLLSLAGCSTSVKVGPEAVAGLTPDGTVDMNEVQVAYIGSGGGGSGTLFYHGGVYPFTIGGLGVGGIGASTISAEGEVYKLNNMASFAGAYARAAMASRSATRAAAICGCRTRQVSSCTSRPSARA